LGFTVFEEFPLGRIKGTVSVGIHDVV